MLSLRIIYVGGFRIVSPCMGSAVPQFFTLQLTVPNCLISETIQKF